MRYILTILFSFYAFTIFSQVQIQNPSFETFDRFTNTPDFWRPCSGSPDLNPISFPATWNWPAQHGSYYYGFGAGASTFVEGIDQELSSPLHANQTYHLTLWALKGHGGACCWSPVTNFEVFLGNTLRPQGCDTFVFKAFHSPPFDTVWQLIPVTFTPNQDYTVLTFSAVAVYQPPNDPWRFASYACLDNLSDIYLGPYTGITPDPKEEVVAYPNPTNGPLHVSVSPALEPTGLRVLDVLGRTVLSQPGTSSALLDLSGLPGGVYFLELTMEGSEVVKRVKVLKN